MKKIFMYSGQGSQYYQMGADLYGNNKIFRHWMQKLDVIAKTYGGFSVIDILYDSEKRISDKFDKTLYTHPAIFMVEYAITQVLFEKGVKPDYVLGASLGEYIALAVADCFNYEVLLKDVIDAAKLLERHCQNGSMLAILSEKEVFYNNGHVFKNCELASDNFTRHFVVSGHLNDIIEIEYFLNSRNINFQRLSVSSAFHSFYIDRIEAELKERLSKLIPNKGNIPFISCVYKTINPEITVEYLWDIIRKPICFRETIELINKKEDFIYIDLGSSGTLSTFVNNCISSNEKSYSVMTPFGNNEKKIEQIVSLSNTNKLSITQKELEKMKAFIFPGQGSQKKGMGKDLFTEFKELTQKADSILGYSIQDLCVNDPENQLLQTQYSQVALFVVNAMHYFKKIQSEEKPDFVAGHSLGEFNALLAAGAFDFETGLKLVQRRGLLMSKALGGGMAAVIGFDENQLRTIINENNLDTIDIANYNSPYQIVISGRKEDVLNSQPYFEKAGAKMFMPLNVSGAFHSRYMKESELEFGKYLNSFTFDDLKIPVISNVYARPYHKSKINETLKLQIVSSVKWTESVRYLMGKGVNEFVEIGEGNVLRSLINKIKKEAEPLYVNDEKEMSDLQEITGSLLEVIGDNITKIEKASQKHAIANSVEKDTLINLDNEIVGQNNSLSVSYSKALIYKNGSTEDSIVKSNVDEIELEYLAKVEPKGLLFNEPDKKKIINKENKVVEYDKQKKNGSLSQTEPLLEEINKKNIPSEIIKPKFSAQSLGAKSYKEAYNINYAYAAGALYNDVSSPELIIALSKVGMMSYFGSNGISLEKVEKGIKYIQSQLGNNSSFGLNIIYDLYDQEREENLIELYLRNNIRNIELASYMQITKPLVKYRLKGLKRTVEGEIVSGNRIQARVSRPEIAELFLSPAPEKFVQILLENNEITIEQAEWGKRVPMATEICVEADSGGTTDKGVASVLIPTILRLRNEMANIYGYSDCIHLGAAGGIGTPESAASAFLLGADYIVTGSINQCTVEAATSDSVKNMIETINVQDTDYAPAKYMFELGAKVQVLKKGVFFPARANKLFEIYKHYNSLEELDEKLKDQLEKKYFKKTIIEIYQDCKKQYPVSEIKKAEENQKYKMAMIFKWYFEFCAQAALKGDELNKVNYQVYCGPSLGAFNQWVKGTELEKWQNRNVDKIAIKLLDETAIFLTGFVSKFQ